MPEGQAAQIARRYYGVPASARRLPSEHDDTFRLACGDGTARFLRISAPDPALPDPALAGAGPPDPALAGAGPNAAGPAGAARVSFLTAILLHLASAAPDLPVQRIVRALDGSPETRLGDADGADGRIARMTTFLDGSLLRDVPTSARLRRDIGATLATLSRALRRFTHPAAHRTHPWDLQNAPALRAYVDQLPDRRARAGPDARHHPGPGVDARLRGQLLAALDRFDDAVRPALAGTPVQVIHTDFHGDNLLADSRRVTGVLDFGDSLIGPVAMDVAVAACYQLGASTGSTGTSGTDLLAPALDVVAGYHAADPLRPADLPLIAEFIQLRLTARIIVSQRNAAREPANAGYLLRRTPQAIEHFTAYRAIGPEAVAGRLRRACGLD
jgi:Ser/Thr protein kinase RdoA (MazF antagonist)